MTGLTEGTYVLIADGEKALLLRNVGEADFPHLQVARKEVQENPATREQGASPPGRFNDGPSVHRSAVEETDWHRLAKERFADDLSDMLYKRVHSGRIDRLVLVASPMVLGALRNKLHKAVSEVVVAEIDKTLTNHPMDEIEKLVISALAEG
jgi:protein required for attachment to host cells